MPRHWKLAVGLLILLVVAASISFPALLRSVLNLKRASTTEIQARRAIAQPSISTPTDTSEKAQIFWISLASQATLEPATVELPLSAEPEQRAKQLITALIDKAPSAAQRTLPADTTLLALYLLPDGTAVADFSEAIATETPSGILNEQMVVDSIVRTLAANITTVYRLKILIRGQQTETLAGHLDLTGFFPVQAATAAESPTTSTSPPALTAPSNAPPSAEHR